MDLFKIKNKAFLASFRAKWTLHTFFSFYSILSPILGLLAPFLAGILILLGICGCSTTKLVPVENQIKEVIEIRDSIIFKDSIVYIPQEKIVEVVPELDTLKMEIEMAKAEAYLDTSMMMLRGKLESKLKPQTEYIERIEYKERIDTIYIEKPQPYEVEKPYTPSWCWWSLIFNLGVIFFLAFKLYIKLKF